MKKEICEIDTCNYLDLLNSFAVCMNIPCASQFRKNLEEIKKSDLNYYKNNLRKVNKYQNNYSKNINRTILYCCLDNKKEYISIRLISGFSTKNSIKFPFSAFSIPNIEKYLARNKKNINGIDYKAKKLLTNGFMRLYFKEMHTWHKKNS